jgi:hypothetical protein
MKKLVSCFSSYTVIYFQVHRFPENHVLANSTLRTQQREETDVETGKLHLQNSLFGQAQWLISAIPKRHRIMV